ncbi:hypothetical protein WN51_11855 [Melipona quadrifasciata]|uniref:Uncharacterized protein n=1 Tax=Melipona quadrifasciata TaxID=166423 RepID=A0A0M9A595_9HYME|nr:hypothetical protein WN51_11855 [Melipona quadrifasciata]
MDFKVSYLDAGLTNSYFSDSDSLTGSVMTPTLPSQPTSQRVNRRYKTQLRDFLSTCRNKRTKLTAQSSVSPPATPTVASVDYLAADTSAAAAVAAAYSNLNTMYPTAYAPTAVAASTDPSLTTYIGHTGNYHQTLYPATALDNRYLTAATENLFQYRPLGSYYPEYHTSTAYNGFIDVSLPTYETHQLTSKAEEKLYCQQLGESPKYSYVETRHPSSVSGSPYAASPVASASTMHTATADINIVRAGSRHSLEGGASSSNSAGSSPVTGPTNGVLTPKIEDVKPEVYGNEAPRQTVLMWGAPPARTPPRNNGSYSPPTPHSTHSSTHSTNATAGDPLKSLAEMNSMNGETQMKRGDPKVVANNGETRSFGCSTPPSAVGTGTGIGMGIGPDSSTSNSNALYHPPHHHSQHQHAVGSSAAGMGPTVPQIPNRTPGVLCCPSLRFNLDFIIECSTLQKLSHEYNDGVAGGGTLNSDVVDIVGAGGITGTVGIPIGFPSEPIETPGGGTPVHSQVPVPEPEVFQ